MASLGHSALTHRSQVRKHTIIQFWKTIFRILWPNRSLHQWLLVIYQAIMSSLYAFYDKTPTSCYMKGDMEEVLIPTELLYWHRWIYVTIYGESFSLYRYHILLLYLLSSVTLVFLFNRSPMKIGTFWAIFHNSFPMTKLKTRQHCFRLSPVRHQAIGMCIYIYIYFFCIFLPILMYCVFDSGNR